MNEDCLLFETCTFKSPILKSRYLRRTPTDFYAPSYCNFCHDYKPIPNTIINETYYVENVTDGKFLKLQAQVHTLSETVNKIQSIKKKQLKDII